MMPALDPLDARQFAISAALAGLLRDKLEARTAGLPAGLCTLPRNS